MQCQQLLDVILPSMFTSFFHKSPKVWSIQASLISNCFWPNVSAMQAFLFPLVKGVSMVTKPMKRNRVLSLTYDVSSVEPVELADPLFSVTPPPEIGKKRKSNVLCCALVLPGAEPVSRAYACPTQPAGRLIFFLFLFL
jgi:hypothetical protein